MFANSSSSNHESFEAVSGRLRVINSCDHCRSRKIKCARQHGQAKCDSCIRFQVECTFNARSKYYSDREKVVASRITGGSGNMATTTTTFSGGSSMITFTPSGMPPATNGSFPPVASMPYFIELFFKYYCGSLPFVSYEAVVAGYLQSSLSALMSNAIASLASKHSQEMKELSSIDSRTAPEYYANQTKEMLRSLVNSPSIDVLSGLVLVAFYEHGCGRMEGLTFYAKQAAHMVQVMGLQNDATVGGMSHSMEQYQQILSLRNIVSQLYQMVTAK